MLEVQGLEPVFRIEPKAAQAVLLSDPALQDEPVVFSVSVSQEDAWARWASGAKVCEMPVFRSEGCARLAVPALPRKADVSKGEVASFRIQSRQNREWLRSPGVRRQMLDFPHLGTRSGLKVVLGLPVAISAMEIPKALNMRYTLQLVRSSGENIRNLEMLGLFRIPTRGVLALRHDAKTGRVLLDLGSEASGAKRAPFILARRRTDLSFVSCFVED